MQPASEHRWVTFGFGSNSSMVTRVGLRGRCSSGVLNGSRHRQYGCNDFASDLVRICARVWHGSNGCSVESGSRMLALPHACPVTSVEASTQFDCLAVLHERKNQPV